MKTLNETVREIVAYARKSGLDEITEVQDYFCEKDSHFNRREIERMIAQFEKEKNENQPR